MTIAADQIRAFRQRHNLTQRQLAKMLGLPGASGRMMLARWEHCTRPVDANYLLPLALHELERRLAAGKPVPAMRPGEKAGEYLLPLALEELARRLG